MPGRTDNEIKNLWHTHIKKKLIKVGIDPLTHKPIHADPPTNDNQDHGVQSLEEAEQSTERIQEQNKGQEIDGISLLEEPIIINNEDQLDKENVAMDMITNDNFSVHEVPWSEPHEIFVPNCDEQSASSSTTTALTTISMSSINSILEDLKFLPSFEDWQSDDNNKNYIGTTGFSYDDDFTDWDWLINDFDIDKIDHEIIQSLPDPSTAQERS